MIRVETVPHVTPEGAPHLAQTGLDRVNRASALGRWLHAANDAGPKCLEKEGATGKTMLLKMEVAAMPAAWMTRKDLVRRLLQESALPHEFELALPGLTVRVATNDRPLHETLCDYYRHFRPHPSGDATPAGRATIRALEAPEVDLALSYHPRVRPGGKRIKEEYADLPDGRVVRKRSTGMVFVFGEDEYLTVGPCRANPNQVINFINNRFLLERLHDEAVLAHAAGVRVRGRGIAMAGFSGAGKSTLALHYLARGADLVSNDRLVLDRAEGRLRMTGLPKYPRINPGTILSIPPLRPLLSEDELRRYGALDPQELWHVEQKYDALIEPIFGVGFELESRVDGLIILNWRLGGGPSRIQHVDLESRDDLLDALMKRRGLFYLPQPGYVEPELSPQGYRDVLRGVPVVEITGGVDFAAAVERSLELLEI